MTTFKAILEPWLLIRISCRALKNISNYWHYPSKSNIILLVFFYWNSPDVDILNILQRKAKTACC